MNSTVPNKNTGDPFAATELNNVVAAVNSKQDSLNFTPENVSNKGMANGYASLDSTGRILASQWPAGIDEIIEYDNVSAFPATGVSEIIYLAKDTNAQYRWSGSVYIEISASPGTTDNVTEGTVNKYFTATRVLATVLTDIGFSTATAILATDSILQALGKLQSQINGLAPILTPSTSGTSLSFTQDKIYGSKSTPEMSNITADITGALLGVTVLIIHNSGSTPTFDDKFHKLSGSGEYVTGSINYIFCTYIADDEIIYTINQRS